MASLACTLLHRIDRQSLSNTSPPSAIPPTLPPVSSLKGDEDCFNAAADPRLIPAQVNDCYQAALLFRQKGSLTRPLVFTRKPTRSVFPLPQVLRAGTCVISVDVVNDDDEDEFTLEVANNGALGIAMDCVWGSSHVGGKKFVGPKKVVYVMVFGRNPPPISAAGGLVQLMPNVTNNVTLEIA